MVLQYKCPDCGSDMVFDSTSGMLSCGSCGRKDNIEDFPKQFTSNATEDMTENTSSPNHPQFGEDTPESHTFSENDAKEYCCKNCGAVILTDSDTTATVCSFCGAGVVLGDRLSGSLAPSKLIPFSISKEQAQTAFKTWCKRGLLTPRDFMTADRIKSITGIYVPFWLYDMHCLGDVNATCTKVRTYTKGDYIYTETKYYSVYRDIDVTYLKIPADASTKMNDELMDKLEPFYYDNLKDFNTPYLAGYIAEKYNYTDNDLFSRVKKRVSNYVDTYISSTITGYSSTTYVSKNLHLNESKAYYTLLPIWMVCYDYKKSEHIFAMNGQTGKIVGTPPLSKGKIAAWFGGISGITFLILKGISLLLGGGLL